MSTNSYPSFDLSGGVQNATSFLLKKPNELSDVRNGRFGVELGSVVRRYGSQRVGSTFGAGGQNTPTGGFVAKFTGGNVRFVAVNNSGNTATIIRTQNSGTGAWTTLTGITGLPVNAQVYFFLHMNEVYITGYDPVTGDPITPYNVNSALDVSTTRNIAHMPDAYFLQEYLGALYACNVKIDSTRYPDRAYKSSGPLGAITFVQAAQTGAIPYITLDSVRYIKSGDALDIYTGGTETKLHDITVTSVDKVNNRIYFTPDYSSTFTPANVDAFTNLITVTANIPTGTPITVSSTSAVPGGLTAGTKYYAINVSATTIRVAATLAQATGGLGIDITTGGATQTFATAAVNTGTEVITLGNTTSLATGMPVVITSTTTVPGGLTSGTVYYAIVLSSTTIQLATTENNANAGTAINITSQGTGTHTITSGLHTVTRYYELADNDEIWADGRKGMLTTFWNTDYRTPENSDWIATRPGTGSSNEITGVGKSSNRLFLWTKNSGQKYDGNEVKTFNNAVGCVAHRSIANIDDDWIIWLDSKGRVWARNESTGQQEHISRGLKRRLMNYVSMSNLEASSAGVYDNQYYLYLGQNNTGKGNEYHRAVYSFDDNVWSVDRVSYPTLFMDSDDYTNELKPYFFSTDGYLYIDETGNLDHDKVIPFELALGRDNQGSQRLRAYTGLFLYTEGAVGMTIKVSVDNAQPNTVGQITSNEQQLVFANNGDSKLPRGTSAEVFLEGASKGDPQTVRGYTWFFSPEEDVPSGRRPKN